MKIKIFSHNFQEVQVMVNTWIEGNGISAENILQVQQSSVIDQDSEIVVTVSILYEAPEPARPHLRSSSIGRAVERFIEDGLDF